jgi:sugar O-acyltransferase (sialic acid O-acetyltransferase NeuD family)
MKKIVIIGSGGHARVILSEILLLKKFKVLGFIDDYLPEKYVVDKEKKLVNLGKIRNISSIISNDTYGIIGVGENHLRKKIVNQIKKIKKNFKWATIISRNAIVAKKVSVGDGTVIIPGSVINNGTKIGNHCIINTRSSIGHDNFFSDFSSSGPGVTVGGGVFVGESSYLGIGSTVIQGIKIMENTIIGGHSFVNKNCKKNSVYFGIPAKRIKSRKSKSKYLKINQKRN